MKLRLAVPSLAFIVSLMSAGATPSVPPSAQPPGGLPVAAVPQFVLIGFDDNPGADPIDWLVDFLATQRNPAGAGQAETFDGTPVRVTFFSNGKFWNKPAVVAAHRRAFAAGHEIANHTLNHGDGRKYSVEQWRKEIGACDDAFAAAGIPREAIRGVRAPYLAYNAAMFELSAAQHRRYDSSVEEGWQADQDGTNFLWPYTLDEGSPGDAVPYAGRNGARIGKYPGLWEIPIHVFQVPADEQCTALGIAPGLRERVRAGMLQNYQWKWDPVRAKITGLDWNVMEQAGRSGAEFLAILKHTLDLRLAGNRAPMMICGHTHLYPADQPERRRALEQFIQHALGKPEVRIVTGSRLADWMERPVPLAPVR